MSKADDKLAEEIAAVKEQDRIKQENIRLAAARKTESAALTIYGEAINDPRNKAVAAVQSEINGHVENSLDELADVIEKKGSAKEMAQALRPAAMLVLARDMLSQDTKTSQGAALQILNRSDGTGKGEGDDKPPVTVNIMNVTNEELGRRLAFIDRLREEKNGKDQGQEA